MASEDQAQTQTPDSATSTRSLGLHKSDSIASHVSVPVTGAYPLGALRIHDPDETTPVPASKSATPLLSRKVLMKPLPPAPPPPDGEDIQEPLGGDVALVLDLPAKFTVGVDEAAFSAKTFQGVRNISSGAHFLWVSETEASSMRSGVWFLSNPETKEHIHVVQWDRYNGVLNEPLQTEARIQRASVGTMFAELPPLGALIEQMQAATAPVKGLPLGAKNGVVRWDKLTSCVSESVLTRVTGCPTSPWQFHTTDRVRGSSILPAEIELEKHVSVVAVSELNFHFSQTDKTYNVSSVGAARTEAAVDATQYIQQAIEGKKLPSGNRASSPSSGPVSPEDLVGELQLVFLLGMHLGNESCVHQWWHAILTIFLRAPNLAVRLPNLCLGLIETLTAQLAYDASRLDGSVFEFGADYAETLRLSLIVYKRRLHDLLPHAGEDERETSILKAFARLEALVVSALGWDLSGEYVRRGKMSLEDGEEVEVELAELEAEDERGEYAPAVVDLDGEGRQKDLVSW